MMLAIAATRCTNEVQILDSNCVSISFPNFFEIFEQFRKKIYNMIITIDGPSGVGKGTVAKIISKKLNINYLDSGAMYRALALYADMHNIKENDSNKLKKLLIDIHIQFINEDGIDKVYLNTEDVTDEIRTSEISKLASKFASLEIVRGVLREMQKRIVRKKKII